MVSERLVSAHIMQAMVLAQFGLYAVLQFGVIGEYGRSCLHEIEEKIECQQIAS